MTWFEATSRSAQPATPRCPSRRAIAAWSRSAGAALALALLAQPRSAEATSRLVGSDYISRPLVLPEGVLRLDAGPRRPYAFGQLMPAGQLQFFINQNGEDAALIVPGAGYGVIDKLELGGVWPLQISPDLNLSDLSAYGKYSLQRGHVEVAGYAEIRIPIESHLELTGGIPVFVHLSNSLRIETGGFLSVGFPENDTYVAIRVPASVPIQVSPEAFVGPELGIEIVDFDDVAIPVGVIAGYTLGGISSIGDLLARLTITDIGSGADVVRLDLGAELFFDL